EYKKGKHHLVMTDHRYGESEFCCLGLLACLDGALDPEDPQDWHTSNGPVDRNDVEFYDPHPRMHTLIQQMLARLNDISEGFEPVAKLVDLILDDDLTLKPEHRLT